MSIGFSRFLTKYFWPLCILGVILRTSLFGFVSSDMREYFLEWHSGMLERGIQPALTSPHVNYPPLYTYLLYLVTIIPVDPLFAIKSFHAIFDLYLAFIVSRLVSILTESPEVTRTSALAILFLPTTILNSSVWGQADAIFTSLVISTMLFLIVGQYFNAFLFLSLAISVKPQALFIVPTILVVIHDRRISTLYPLLTGLSIFLIQVPALLAGRTLGAVLTVYGRQPEFLLSQWVSGCPNFYSLFSVPTSALPYATFVASIVFILTTISVFFLWRLSGELSFGQKIVTVGLWSALILPYFLPFMHERYFYLADVLVVVYFFCVRRSLLLVAIVQGTSIASYIPYLSGATSVSLATLAVLPLFAICLIGFRALFGSGGQNRGRPTISATW